MIPLIEYTEAVQGWTDEILSPYVSKLSLLKTGFVGIKEFNDPLWGTIALQPQEIVVLDSPLLQRLRRIRQLGVVHLVYGSANHTRLEHSIGVCHQVGRIATSISSHAASDESITDEDCRLLRLTGLCHDIGHGALSHVVENALKNDRVTRSLIREFTSQHAMDSTPHLSEIAAHAMMQSTRFRELIREAYRIARLPDEPDHPDKMSRMVIGKKVSDAVPLLHELISGPFDADKLDYMPRDAMMTGVPVVTDIGRLIQKVRAVNVASDRLPASLAAVVESQEKGHLVIGLAPSGGSTLDEVAVGRSLMFDKVYRHHKVRAAEAMVAGIIDALGHVLSVSRPLLPLSIFDDQLLNLTPAIAGTLGGNPHDPSNVSELVGFDIAGRLSQRNLFVRAFAFSQHIPEDPYSGQEDHRLALDTLIRDASKPDTRRRLVREIADMVQTMARRLNQSLPQLILENIDRYVWVDPPAAGHPDGKPDPSRAYLIGVDGRPREVRHLNPDQRGWVDAYTNTHDMGYVFTIAELVPLVAVATKIVVFKMYSLRVSDDWALPAKMSPSTIDTIESQLLDTGFYEDIPPALRPAPEKMRVAGIAPRIEEVVKHLSSVQSPTSSPRELHEGGMSAQRVRDWVRQFGAEYEPQALKIAENVRIYGRPETSAALDGFLNSKIGAAFRGGAIVPIGQPKDGSAVVAYHAGEIARDHSCRVLNIADALTSNDPIVFVDDFVSRGSSTISIFQSLMGFPTTEDLNEERPGPLNSDFQKNLTERTVAFLFTAGLDAGPGRLRSALGEMGFAKSIPISVSNTERDLPTVDSVLAEPERARFRNRVADIGRQLLAGVDEGKAADRQLGYGNRGLLIAFPYNTPTATLTAIWKAGVVDTWRWFPILPRRGKL